MNPAVAKLQKDQAVREKRERRNQLQRARRASPEAKAAEARASRRSYWSKKEGYGRCGISDCTVCAKLRSEHDL